MCEMIAIESGLLNAVVAREGKTVTPAELAAEIKQDETFISKFGTGGLRSSDVWPDGLAVRILRVLCVNGICTEVGPYQYQSNEFSKELNTPSQSSAIRIL